MNKKYLNKEDFKSKCCSNSALNLANFLAFSASLSVSFLYVDTIQSTIDCSLARSDGNVPYGCSSAPTSSGNLPSKELAHSVKSLSLNNTCGVELFTNSQHSSPSLNPNVLSFPLSLLKFIFP